MTQLVQHQSKAMTISQVSAIILSSGVILYGLAASGSDRLSLSSHKDKVAEDDIQWQPTY